MPEDWKPLRYDLVYGSDEWKVKSLSHGRTKFKDSQEGVWKIHFQKCKWNHFFEDSTDNYSEDGFRFIWENPQGRLMPYRGQTRIPDKFTMQYLQMLATEDGWF